MSKTGVVIDAWAQPATRAAAAKMPEVLRGHPWTDEMIGLAWKHENVDIDTSAYLPRYYPPQLLHCLKTYGQDKVLFGTNFPQLSLEKCMAQVQELNLPTDIQAKFLGENARRVFNL